MRKIGIGLIVAIIISAIALMYVVDIYSDFPVQMSEMQEDINVVSDSVSGLSPDAFSNSIAQMQGSADKLISALTLFDETNSVDLAADIKSLEEDIKLLLEAVSLISQNTEGVLTSSDIDLVNSAISNLENAINGNKSSVETEIAEVSSMVTSLEKSIKDNSMNIERELNGLHTNFSSLEKDLSLLATKSDNDALKSELSKMLALVGDVSKDLQTVEEIIVSSKIINAEKAFQLASSISELELKDAYYLNALAHDPSNETCFIAYLNFLESIDADYGYYYSLYMLLAESLYSVDAEEVESIVSCLDTVNEKLIAFDNMSEEANLVPVWDALYSDFIAFAGEGKMNYQVFVDTVESMSSIYSLFEEPTEEISEESNYANYVRSLIDIYITAQNSFEIMQDLTYEEFDILYPSVCNIISTALTEFVSRDRNLDKEYARYFSECQSSLIGMQTSLDELYDSLLCKEFNKKYVMKNVETAPLELRILTLNEMQPIISILSSIGTSVQAQKICGWYSNQLEIAQRENFQNYQVWAASALNSIDEKVSDAKNKEKLETLFASGYFNIDSSLLIPQLKTWYDSLYSEKIKEDSTVSFDALLESYPIEYVTLEDVQ